MAAGRPHHPGRVTAIAAPYRAEFMAAFDQAPNVLPAWDPSGAQA